MRLADRHDSGPGLPAGQGDSGGGQGERGQRGGDDRRALTGGEDVALQAQRDHRCRNADLGGRAGHFMKPSMLDSQLAALEVPAGAITVDAAWPVAQIVSEIRAALAAAIAP